MKVDFRAVRRMHKGSKPNRPERKQGHRSLADQVAQRITDELIASGRVQEGQLLPSESELCAMYNVSRVTIRSAIRSLWDHGVISVRNGVGARVLPGANEVRHGLDRLASIDTFARETGKKVGTDHLEWVNTSADADISRKLQIPYGSPVLQVKRSKTIDGQAVAWIIDTLPAGVIDERTLQKSFNGSVLDILLSDGETLIDYADSEVKPCIAKGDVADILSGDGDGLLLFLDSVIISVDGAPLIWGQIWLDPSKFRFSFNRRRFR